MVGETEWEEIMIDMWGRAAIDRSTGCRLAGRTRCFQHFATIVLPGLEEPDCGFLHTYAVDSSLPLHSQFPLLECFPSVFPAEA